jgi:hypothetical protein
LKDEFFNRQPPLPLPAYLPKPWNELFVLKSTVAEMIKHESLLAEADKKGDNPLKIALVIAARVCNRAGELVFTIDDTPRIANELEADIAKAIFDVIKQMDEPLKN